jgi:predicted O-methyltransferase YrrM
MTTISADAPAGSPPSAAGATPEPIMRIASGFMAAKHLFAASELGLFEALADSPATIEGLAARTGLTPRAARISADAMVALGLLERTGDSYCNGAAAGQFLTGRTPADLRPFLRFWDRISYPAWTTLAASLAGGPPTEIFELDDELQEIASSGIEAVLAGPANALPHAVDLSARRALLDVGGGTGSWTVALLRKYPQLRATVLDLPVVADIARSRAAAAGLDGRIQVLPGDAMADPLPGGYDTFLVANLVHYLSPDGNRTLLTRLRDAAERGALLMLADFWTDATHTEPVHAALMAGEFAVHLAHGDVYSVDEIRTWLGETGWTFVTHAALAGPQSVVVAELR